MEAWRIGAEIAAAVTAANPPPVTLKLEKVYDPCTLLTKKRYAGYMYESPNQTAPTWDAKVTYLLRHFKRSIQHPAHQTALRTWTSCHARPRPLGMPR